jgi:trehalose utilization protein
MNKQRQLLWAIPLLLTGVCVMCLASCKTVLGSEKERCVVVWSEGTAPKEVYPHDINGAVAEGLAGLEGWEVVRAGIEDPDQGLPDKLLNRADVLVWWGHKRHRDVQDALVDKIEKRVKEEGMGFIALHSAHASRPNKRLMGSRCSFKAYVNDSTTLKITVADAKHPIAKGVEPEFTLNHDERYSDPYRVPKPESSVFDGVATLKDGSVDPSHQGYCWTIGKGRMFYFQVGHETNPVFYDKNIRKIMANAVQWAAPSRNGNGQRTNNRAVGAIGIGSQPPEGADVLIDGTRRLLDEEWTYWEGPRFSSSLPIKWKIVDDPVDPGTALVSHDPAADGGKYGAADIVTKKKYRDFRLHIEFLVPKKGGNSGVYLQNRYEIQVLDGDPGKHGMAAVINEAVGPYHAYNGTGKWNAFDISFRAARFKDGKLVEKALVSMYFNGVKAHTNQRIQKVWGGANSGIDGGNRNGEGITDVPGGLKLQCEGHQVLYRNAWIKELDIEKADTDF